MNQHKTLLSKAVFQTKIESSDNFDLPPLAMSQLSPCSFKTFFFSLESFDFTRRFPDEPFTTQSRLSTTLRKRPSENLVEKRRKCW